MDGLPVRLPMVDLHTVGAGGGSLAWLDAAARFGSGRRARSRPRPGRLRPRRKRATVTDANLLLGRLPAQLAGGLTLDKKPPQRR